MIHITDSGTKGDYPPEYSYIQERGLLGRLLLPVTRYLRCVNAERFMEPSDRHLDIGCGDGYFLKRSACKERFGLDRLLGDEVTDTLNFPDDHFDYVTLLGVMEHLENPEGLVREVHRVLKPGGRLIFTTPKEASDLLIRLYARNLDEEHESYFDYPRVEKMTAGLFRNILYRTFLLGLNQVFMLEK